MIDCSTNHQYKAGNEKSTGHLSVGVCQLEHFLKWWTVCATKVFYGFIFAWVSMKADFELHGRVSFLSLWPPVQYACGFVAHFCRSVKLSSLTFRELGVELKYLSSSHYIVWFTYTLPAKHQQKYKTGIGLCMLTAYLPKTVTLVLSRCVTHCVCPCSGFQF